MSIYWSLSAKQIFQRYRRLRKVLTEEGWIACMNFIALIMIDIFLGTLCMVYINNVFKNYTEFEIFLDMVLQILLKLLTWLNGSPAGLKLNTPLNEFFHGFYAYHLELWKHYIGFMDPFLRLWFHGVMNMGWLGLTVQLSMAKDLLSLTSFHIYCLYIYATKLFNVELNTIKSLSRLSMGRKWNPLRNRFDHITLSLSEMFLGTSGFTIALFLFPTIWIYYAVFLALRLPLLLVESSVELVIQFFNSLELVTAFLVYTNSKCLPNELYLNPLPSAATAASEESVHRFEIRTQVVQQTYYKIPKFQQPFLETLSKILESRIIT